MLFTYKKECDVVNFEMAEYVVLWKHFLITPVIPEVTAMDLSKSVCSVPFNIMSTNT